jgi:hypothetical protein
MIRLMKSRLRISDEIVRDILKLSILEAGEVTMHRDFCYPSVLMLPLLLRHQRYPIHHAVHGVDEVVVSRAIGNARCATNQPEPIDQYQIKKPDPQQSNRLNYQSNHQYPLLPRLRIRMLLMLRASPCLVRYL